MRRVNSFFCFLLAIIFITSIFIVPSTNVRADETYSIPGWRLKGSVLSWDDDPDIKNRVKIAFKHSKTGEYAIEATPAATNGENTCDLREMLSAVPNARSGYYNVELTAKGKSGKQYMSTITYSFYRYFINEVTDIKIDNKGLSWKFDSNLPAGLEYEFEVTVTVDGTFDTRKLMAKECFIPAMRFAMNGTHNYNVSINTQTVTDSDYRYSFTQAEFHDITISGLKQITGIKEKDGIISWDPVPGASGYRISTNVLDLIETGHKSSFGLEDSSSDPCTYLDALIHKRGGLDNQTLKLIILAYDANGTRLAAPTEYEYEYGTFKEVTYPLSVYGTPLTSNDDLAHIADCSIRYYPSDKSLVFDDVSLESFEAAKKANGIDVGNPAFSSTEDLFISGNAELSGRSELFVSSKKIEFKKGSSINITSEGTGVHAANIVCSGKDLSVSSRSGSPITADKSVYIKSSAGTVSATSSDSNAIIAGIANKSGKIDIADDHEISEPVNGILDGKGKTILNADGSAAKSVKVSKLTPTPTPVPTATATPIPKPTGSVSATPAVTTAPAKPASATTAPTSPDSQILAFVERIYRYVLDREPEAEGAAFWSDELYAFRRTGAEVAQGFIFSPEFENRNTTDEQFVTILYKTFFGRDPEEEGMKFWLSQLASGTMDRVTVANGFIYSQEWADTCASYGIRSGGDLKPTGKIAPTELTYAFVERMYTTAMGRGYDEEGRQYWASELANFNITGEACGASFFLSAEMEGYNFSDKEFLGRLYATFMNRDADADGEAYWLSQMTAGVPRSDIVLGFTRSPEFTDKCVEARILPY